MTISDGTTTFTVNQTLCRESRDLVRGTVTSAGGLLKTQISGLRFEVIERFYVSGTNVQSLFDLLTNNSNYYYYTPSFDVTGLSSSEFPMSVEISLENLISIGSSEIRYDVSLRIRSVDYV